MNSSVVGEETWTGSNPASSCHLSFIYSYRWSIQVESVIFLLLTDRDKQIVVIWLPWQLLAQELQWRFLQWSRMHRNETLTVSIDKYRHILWFCSRKKCAQKTQHQRWQTSGKIQMKGDQTLATPCKYVTVVPSLLLHLRSSGPNVHRSWHMAMASTWGMRGQRSRAWWPRLMGWPTGYECYLI